MDSIEENCKHNRLPRNCYLCYLHRHDNEPVNLQDMIFTTLSELKVRIAKLEEYKRLQDDDIKKQDEARKEQFKESYVIHEKVKHMQDQQNYHEEKLNILLIRMDKLDLAIRLANDYEDEPKTTGLTFEEAIVAFKNGKKIKRNAWGAYHWLLLHNKSSTINNDDIMNNDWEIID